MTRWNRNERFTFLNAAIKQDTLRLSWLSMSAPAWTSRCTTSRCPPGDKKNNHQHSGLEIEGKIRRKNLQDLQLRNFTGPGFSYHDQNQHQKRLESKWALGFIIETVSFEPFVKILSDHGIPCVKTPMCLSRNRRSPLLCTCAHGMWYVRYSLSHTVKRHLLAHALVKGLPTFLTIKGGQGNFSHRGSISYF